MLHEHEIMSRLTSIEEKLDMLAQQPPLPEHLSVAEFAKRVGREEFTVREWCRLGRIRAEKRRCGRGDSKEWKIPRDELNRWRSDGLLPDYRGAK